MCLLCSIIDHFKYYFICTLPIGDKENDLLKPELLKKLASFNASLLLLHICSMLHI